MISGNVDIKLENHIIWLTPNKLRYEMIVPLLAFVTLLLLPVLIIIISINIHGFDLYVDLPFAIMVEIIIFIPLYILVKFRFLAIIKRLGIQGSQIIIDSYDKNLYSIDSKNLVYTDGGFFIDKKFFSLSVDDFSLEQLVKHIYPLLAQGRYIKRSEIPAYIKSLQEKS